MKHRIDPYGARLPIKLDTTSNGEFLPVPLSDVNRAANRLAHDEADRKVKRLALPRRDFLISACGAASTLLAFNQTNAAAGKRGGWFALDQEAALDQQLAAASVEGKEFIFDVQGHFVNPQGAWIKTLAPEAQPLKFATKTSCEKASGSGARSYLNCLNHEEFIKDVFLDSDTDMMVLSFVPSRRNAGASAHGKPIPNGDRTRKYLFFRTGPARA